MSVLNSAESEGGYTLVLIWVGWETGEERVIYSIKE